MTNSDKLVEILAQIAILSTSVARVEEKLKGLEEKVQEVHRTVHGYNGDPGLLAEVRTLKAFMDSVSDKVGSLKDATSEIGNVASDQKKLETEVHSNPTYIYLLKNYTKETVVVSLAILLAITAFVLEVHEFSQGSIGIAIAQIFLKYFGLPTEILK